VRACVRACVCVCVCVCVLLLYSNQRCQYNNIIIAKNNILAVKLITHGKMTIKDAISHPLSNAVHCN